MARNVSNGTAVTFYSLVLAEENHDDYATIREAKEGDDIIIQPPMSVTVELPNEDPNHYSDVTLVRGKAVIGLLMDQRESLNVSIQGTNKRIEVTVKSFGTDGGCASTFHKLQGKYVKRTQTPPPSHLQRIVS